MSDTPGSLGFVFIDGYADWEYGLLAASAREWFGMQTAALTPDGKPVRGIAGFSLQPDRSVCAGGNGDLDAVVVIGSDNWTQDAAPDISPLLLSIAARGGVVAGICGGAVPLAQAGFFAEARHTSNGRVWLQDNAPGYRGQGNYEDVPHAVADAGVVSAPGCAPGTFALAVLGAMLPGAGERLKEMRVVFGKEYADAS